MTDDADMAGPAWAFAISFYARPGVADACLCLQDRAGLDVVNMLMLIYAHTELRKPLSAAEQAELAEKMRDWRETTVLPLRKIRRALKPSRTDVADEKKELLRNEIKKTELMAERLQIEMAAQWLITSASGTGLSLPTALQALLPAGGGTQDAETAAALKCILDAAESVRAG